MLFHGAAAAPFHVFTHKLDFLLLTDWNEGAGTHSDPGETPNHHFITAWGRNTEIFQVFTELCSSKSS